MTPCKICGSPTQLAGTVDAGYTCEAHRGGAWQKTGVGVAYRKCGACGFLFTRHFDAWTLTDFRREIYNADYDVADPDYASGARATANAETVENLCAATGLEKVLDYGGGNGLMAELLRSRGVDAVSWDIMNLGERPTGQFGLVTAFEVLEHTPTPHETLDDILGFVAPAGRFFFSTLIGQDVGSWYCAPRNGHVSLHTAESLQAMFARVGWSVHSFSANVHMARAL